MPATQWALNSTLNAATGNIPYEVFFGYKPKGGLDAFLEDTVDIRNESPDLEGTRGEAV